MFKRDVIAQLINHQSLPQNTMATAFAPSNIALCKYWGKRNHELNLPVTSSLSVSLGDLGTTTTISFLDSYQDKVTVNGQVLTAQDKFVVLLTQFLDLFRLQANYHFAVDTFSNIPIAAGLASSASGFAALVLALDNLFGWQLSRQQLSILARLGSGSACRSLWPGFVEWQMGQDDTGFDSHGIPITNTWPDLYLGIIMISAAEKSISSRQAMALTQESSLFYSQWPEKVQQDFTLIKQAIMKQDFKLLGQTIESNAIAMHATMLTSTPPICYLQAQTWETIQKIWQLRQQSFPLYFTQDAGPNIKLLFEAKQLHIVQREFPQITVVKLFSE